MEWSKQPPAEWVARLEQIVPAEGNSWLMLRWEPGEAWWPIHRWALWQVRPREVTALLYPEQLAELEGPDPRRTGHACFPGWCDCKVKAMAWKGGTATLIDWRQWNLYQETGLFGTRWWCIEGTEGGHRWSLSAGEKHLRQLAGEVPDVPVAGSLPYAEFDERVVSAIMREDRRRRGLVAARDLQQIAAQRDRLEAAERAARADAAEAFVARREEQTADAAGEFVRRFQAFHGDMRGVPTTREDRVAAAAAEERDMARMTASIADAAG